MRIFDQLSQEDKDWVLYGAAVLSYSDVKSGIILPAAQEQSAIEYGSKYEINSDDYAASETIFPTNGDPKPPQK